MREAALLKSLALPAALVGGVIGCGVALIVVLLLALGLAFLKPYAPALAAAGSSIMEFKVLGGLSPDRRRRRAAGNCDDVDLCGWQRG